MNPLENTIKIFAQEIYLGNWSIDNVPVRLVEAVNEEIKVLEDSEDLGELV